MNYFVVVNSVEEINNEIKQKTRKWKYHIKNPKNVNVLTERAKGCNEVFRLFR